MLARSRRRLASLLLVAAQLWLLGPGRSAVVQADAAPPTLPASVAAVSTVQAPASLAGTLDLIVGQSLSATGWHLTTLRSQLDQGATEGSALRQTGSGRWQIALLDDKQQPVTLDGPLAFTVEADTGGAPQTALTATIRGTLTGSGVAVAVQTDVTGQAFSDRHRQTVQTALQLTRAGATTPIERTQTDDTRSLAYGVSETVDRTILKRDTTQEDSSRTITIRAFGHGESEVWLKGMVGADPSQPATVHADAHFFQRATDRDLVDFYDRFDAQVTGKDFSLQSPATVTTTADGRVHSDVVMLDGQGKPLLHGEGKGAGLAAPLPGDPAMAVQYQDGRGTIAQATTWAPRLASNPGSPQAVTCDNGALAAAAALIAIAGVLALVTVVALAAAPVSVVLVTAAGVAVVPTAAVSAGFIGGLGAASIAATLAGVGVVVAGCNADPSFIVPDIRAADDPASTEPIQVTRASGGLLAVEAAPSVPAAATSSSTSSLAAATGSLQSADRPETFVGGALPAKAGQFGAWTWDPQRSFGSVAGHTAGLIAGPQQQYFLHAAPPLALTVDDNLIQYVYLDPQHAPTEIYLQFYTGDGDGEHRAFWGNDRVQTGGKAGTASLYPMGALPTSGGWVRLQIPVDKLGLGGKPINGVLYGSFDGQTWWGPTTNSSRSLDTAGDATAVDMPATPPATIPGAQIAYRLTQPTHLTSAIVDANGAPVRTLLKEQDQPAGYQVIIWDGKDDAGTAVADRPYRVQFLSAGAIIAEHGVTITPFVAAIQTPSDFSLVRGNNVTVIGEAYGTAFSGYTLDYGQGAQPVTWTTITTSDAPVLVPRPGPVGANPSGNLADWNVGLSEFIPYTADGLNGLYTLRLRVFSKDGREAADSVRVVVGRLAHTAEGGTIVSPDGKARLLVPPLATQHAFALLAILPLAQSDPSGKRGAALPKDRQPAGPIYEIMGADETFRRPATLELPYDAAAPPAKLGVLLGDGTPEGWRYLGGTADPKRQVISVAVSEFGGSRALVAPFTADQFGPIQPYRISGAPLTFSAADAAPLVSSSTHPVAFVSDLQSAPGEWQALDVFGTQLTRVTGTDAGLTTGNAALKVTHLAGGARVVQVSSTAYDATKYPLLAFDYRLPGGYAPNVLLHSNGIWWQLGIGDGALAYSSYYRTVAAPPLLADDAWHHVQLDVLAYLRANQPANATFQVDAIVLGQYQSGPFMQVTPRDQSAAGSAYYLRNIAALAPVRSTVPTLTFTPPAGAAYTAYSVTLDTNNDTLAPPQAPDAATTVQVHLPAGAADGLWYAHVRGRRADGAWSAPAHFPLLIDRRPPVLTRPDPAAGGAGSPNFISFAASDAVSGVDLASLRVTLNGQAYGASAGLTYDPATARLEIIPSHLQPAAPTLANGQKVDIAVSALADYAGNGLAAPFAWSFIADQPTVSGDTFRALTAAGGTEPALSPDGSRLAFVSSRSGTGKVWLVDTADYGEQGKSAKPLTSGTAHESAPEWSPDGRSLAYISDVGGTLELWISAADGSGSHALTAGAAAVASPTWSPDGQSLAFIHDGNLWQVAADGSNAHALTTLPDHPFQSVRWQPGGQLLAVHFKLYEDRIELFDPATGDRQQLTHGGKEREPVWLNDQTVLYTAPAGAGQPDAIWQSNLDGSNQVILPGSGQPGVDDAQATAAASGDAVALVSTRGGNRDIWLQTSLQIARFALTPTGGAVPGDTQHITYTLPAAATVTLQVQHGDTNARTLLDAVQQAKGTQDVIWDGLDAAGKALSAGDYTLKLLAQVSSGDAPLVRYATGRLLDAATIGSLQLQINQWADQPAATVHPQVQVFAAGTSSGAVAEAAFDTAPLLKLPAGHYDVVITFDGGRQIEKDVVIDGGKTTTHPIDLHLGELDVTALTAPGQAATENVSVQVISSTDPTANARTSFGGKAMFILPPGSYDVHTTYQGLHQETSAVVITAGQVAIREVNLGSGTLHVNVLAYPGQPTNPGILAVAAFAPGNHTDSVAEVGYTSSPVDLHLAAGTYDLHIGYSVSPDQPHIGGTIDTWSNGVTIAAGQTLTQDVNLGLGEAALTVLEATGKPADANRLGFYIVPHGERDYRRAIVGILYLNTALLQLHPGTYDVIADYDHTNLEAAGPVGAPFEVKEGQRVSEVVDLRLGRLRVEVSDGSGRRIDDSHVSFRVSPPGKPDEYSPSADGTDPLGLPLVAGRLQDALLELNDGKRLVVPGQTVNEGETLVLKVKVDDFH
jgi:flagellar hook assembly protein FlgD